MDASEIKKVFQDHSVPFSNDDYWKVQQTYVVKHKALERLAGALKITFDDPKMMVQKDDSLVMFVRGYRPMGNDQVRTEWSIGEVSMGREGANYRVSGKQAGYPWAMVEKRAKDRVILKLAGLYGLYSEDEADEFKADSIRLAAQNDKGSANRQPPPAANTAEAPQDEAPATADATPSDPETGEVDPVYADLHGRITAADSINKITDLMLDPKTQEALAAMTEEARQGLRAFATKRLKQDFGWGKKTEPQAA
ncbi:trna delta -isopentenylpyrophosphate transferase [Methylobacterium indicum]|uniref:Uncharacterized protein n=1 Tax=Methylobacterium indicum TaxID=1775910 RepID=A0A8H8X1A0_9HYPH|nr:trna delta -isopentenylpyrophosphate transferase [Methylobacterium indicum]BCM87849.1 hypothetical protein mvi_63100 [Methylobacterium indicum]